MTLKIKDIVYVGKAGAGKKGYVIEFSDGRKISLHKKRTVPALLTLIKNKNGIGCESDLSNGASNLKELKKILGKRLEAGLINDGYSDANKPFSELWNEEGFVFISNPAKTKQGGSQSYVLAAEDHEKLFEITKKANRAPPSKPEKATLLEIQNGKCNLCASKIRPASELPKHTYAKDRSRLVWDHRIPVEKGGDSAKGNYQALCFYCNKCKWQICNICDLSKKSCTNCALAAPEKTSIIAPTGEDIADRVPHR